MNKVKGRSLGKRYDVWSMLYGTCARTSHTGTAIL